MSGVRARGKTDDCLVEAATAVKPAARADDAFATSRAKRIIDVLFFGTVPLLPYLVVATQLIARRRYIADGWFFDGHWLWVGWHHVAHGQNPYVDFLYPSPAAVLPAPLGFLGYRPAMIAWSLILIAAIVLALRLLEVRDWRCYAVALMTMPALSSIHLGTPTPLLLLAAACAWRYRNRPWAVAFAVAFGVGFKILLWPLFVWLVVTRFRTSLKAVAATVLLLVGCWAVIGFAGVTGYGHKLAGTEDSDQFQGFSVIALVHRAGLALTSTHAVAVIVTLACLALIVWLGRRGGVTADRDAYIAALATSVIASPVVWGHYVLIAYAALALAVPTFGIEWLLPLAFWVVPYQENQGQVIRIVLVLVLFVALIVWGARRNEIIERYQRRAARARAPAVTTDQPS
jgi:hypothetical protein